MIRATVAAIAIAIAIVLSTTPSAADAASPPDSVELVELVDEAIGLLEQEAELVPLISPSHTDEPGYAENRVRYQEIEAAGARVIAELRAHDIELTPDISATLGFAEPSVESPPRPPDPEVYTAAIFDLRRIAQEIEPASDGTSLAPLVAVLTVGVIALGGLFALRRHHRRSSRDLEAQILTDPLTGVGNRRRLDRDIERLAADPVDHVAILMIDIDHFKRFNDQHGHRIGDLVLQRFGAMLSEQVRSSDAVYRYGGEEFCVLMPGAGYDEAEQIARRICHAASDVEVAPGVDPVTVSIGVGVGERKLGQETIVLADQALYRAKEAGRNRVVLDTEVAADAG